MVLIVPGLVVPVLGFDVSLCQEMIKEKAGCWTCVYRGFLLTKNGIFLIFCGFPV